MEFGFAVGFLGFEEGDKRKYEWVLEFELAIWLYCSLSFATDCFPLLRDYVVSWLLRNVLETNVVAAFSGSWIKAVLDLRFMSYGNSDGYGAWC